MKKLINNELRRLEYERGVRVLYACESGSRAWGFPSKDSDYDARFIYVHEKDWYLSIDACSRCDQIEIPITDELDIAGWELRKSFNLLMKSNAALLEWFDSPIIYMQDDFFASELQRLRVQYYNPIALMGHYYSMSLKSFEVFADQTQCKIKKMFYALRAALALEWCFRDLGPVPMKYRVMVEELLGDKALIQTIDELQEKKEEATEATLIDLPQNIRSFISETLEKHKTLQAPWVREEVDKLLLNEIFLKVLSN